MPDSASMPPVRASALLALTVALFLLPLASGLPLFDPDEGLHAAIAREMVERGDWVTPRLLGEPFLDKPILFFWAQAASIALLGASEIAVRLPGLLLGLAGALATGWLARALWGLPRGALAMACYATLILPLALAQAAVHDVALVPCVTMALLCFWRAAHVTRAPAALVWGAGAGVWLGLSILAKGLSGVAVTGVAFALWALAARRLRLSLVAGGLVSLVVAAAIAAPWYLAMERANPGYFHYYFVERHLLGFTTTTQIHGQRPWWYYVPILVAGSLPWVVYLPESWRRWRSSTPPAREADLLGWCWLAGATVFLSLSGSKMVTYVWPVFPAVALLASGAWVGAAPSRATRMTHTGFGVVLLPVAAAVTLARFDVAVTFAAWTAAALAIIAWLAAGPHRLGGSWDAASRGAALTGATMLAALLVIMPSVAPTLSARDLAQHVNRATDLPARLWVFDERIGSLLFYLDAGHRAGLVPGSVESVGIDRLLSMRQPPDNTVVAVPREKLGRLTARVDLAGAPRVSAGHYEVFTAEALHAAIVRTIGPAGPVP